MWKLSESQGNVLQVHMASAHFKMQSSRYIVVRRYRIRPCVRVQMLWLYTTIRVAVCQNLIMSSLGLH